MNSSARLTAEIFELRKTIDSLNSELEGLRTQMAANNTALTNARNELTEHRCVEMLDVFVECVCDDRDD